MLVTETISRPWAASQAKPLQLIPPTLPGMASVPCSLGGVNIELPLIAAICAAQAFLSASPRPKASAGVTACGTSGGVLVGIGWVGEAVSPGMALGGTGRSSTGSTG